MLDLAWPRHACQYDPLRAAVRAGPGVGSYIMTLTTGDLLGLSVNREGMGGATGRQVKPKIPSAKYEGR
jgi:hypothetical protein